MNAGAPPDEGLHQGLKDYIKKLLKTEKADLLVKSIVLTNGIVWPQRWFHHQTETRHPFCRELYVPAIDDTGATQDNRPRVHTFIVRVTAEDLSKGRDWGSIQKSLVTHLRSWPAQSKPIVAAFWFKNTRDDTSSKEKPSREDRWLPPCIIGDQHSSKDKLLSTQYCWTPPKTSSDTTFKSWDACKNHLSDVFGLFQSFLKNIWLENYRDPRLALLSRYTVNLDWASETIPAKGSPRDFMIHVALGFSEIAPEADKDGEQKLLNTLESMLKRPNVYVFDTEWAPMLGYTIRVDNEGWKDFKRRGAPEKAYCEGPAGNIKPVA